MHRLYICVTTYHVVFAGFQSLREVYENTVNIHDDHDYLLSPSNAVHPVIYKCTICSQHFSSIHLHNLHSCGAASQLETEFVVTEILKDPLSTELNLIKTNFSIQNTIEMIDGMIGKTSKGPDCSEENMCLDPAITIPELEFNSSEVRSSSKIVNKLCKPFTVKKKYIYKTSPQAAPKRDRNKHNMMCSGCGKGFRQRYYLTSHICDTSGNQPRSTDRRFFICKCGIQFKHRSSFCRHIQHNCKLPEKTDPAKKIITLPEEMPYTCEICGIAIKLKADFLEHRESCDKCFPCKFCGNRFKLETRLRKHLRTYHGLCMTCSASFNTKEELEEHKKVKHIQCCLCKAFFGSQDDLDDHFSKDHLSI